MPAIPEASTSVHGSENRRSTSGRKLIHFDGERSASTGIGDPLRTGIGDARAPSTHLRRRRSLVRVSPQQRETADAEGRGDVKPWTRQERQVQHVGPGQQTVGRQGVLRAHPSTRRPPSGGTIATRAGRGCAKQARLDTRSEALKSGTRAMLQSEIEAALEDPEREPGGRPRLAAPEGGCTAPGRSTGHRRRGVEGDQAGARAAVRVGSARRDDRRQRQRHPWSSTRRPGEP